MNKKTKKILVLTSGGDAPGMNAAVRSVVRMGIHEGFEVFGTRSGFDGIIQKNLFNITSRDVGNIIQRGGTILKTGRCEAFLDPKVRQDCHDYLVEQGIQNVVVLGGNGSFRGAALMAQLGDMNVVGVPCTIDNDIVGTGYTIGFDTARNTALQAIDKIRDTASSHNRNFIVEVMGRNTGFLAVDVGIAGGAEVILIPEYPVKMQALADRINNRHSRKSTSIMIVAEGSELPGRSFRVAEALKQKGNLDYKVCILGHTQRGGTPTVKDRKVATQMGAMAVLALADEKTNIMIGLDHENIIHNDFPPEDHSTRYFSDVSLLEMNDIICEI